MERNTYQDNPEVAYEAEPEVLMPPETSEKHVKKRWTVPLVIASIVLVAAAVVVLLFSTMKSPLVLLSDATNNTLSAMKENSRLMEYIRQHQDYSGSNVKVEVSNAGEILGAVTDEPLLSWLSINGELEITQDPEGNGRVALGLDVLGMLFQAELYTSTEEIRFAMPGNLEGLYGTSREGMEQALAASIFAPQANTAYSLSEEYYDGLIELIRGLPGGEVAKKDEDVAAAAMDAFSDMELEFKKEKAQVELSDKAVSATVISTLLNTEDVITALELLAELSGAFSEEQMQAMITEVTEEESTAALSFVIYDDYLVQITADVAGADNESVLLKLDVGSEPAHSEKMLLEIRSEEDLFTAEYVCLNQTDSQYSGQLLLDVDGETAEVVMDYNWDTGDGCVTIMDSDGVETEVTWNLVLGEAGAGLTMGQLRLDGSTTDLSAISVDVAYEGAVTMPQGEYTDILTMTESDMDAVLEELLGWLSGLMSLGF